MKKEITEESIHKFLNAEEQLVLHTDCLNGEIAEEKYHQLIQARVLEYFSCTEKEFASAAGSTIKEISKSSIRASKIALAGIKQLFS